MEIAEITARGQTTTGIRETANLHEGDMLAFEVEGGCVRRDL